MKKIERVLDLINKSYKVDEIKELVFLNDEKEYRAIIQKDYIEIQDESGEIINKIEFAGTYSYTIKEEKIIPKDGQKEKIYMDDGKND